MSEQPKALRLADELSCYGSSMPDVHEAAAELRRLHEENQKLQQQLGEAVWNYGEKVRVNQELLEALKTMNRAYVNLLQNGRDRITMLGGQCDPVDVMEANDQNLREARAAIAKGEQA